MADAIASKVVEDLYNFMKDKFQQELRAALGVEKEIQNLSSKLNKIRQVLDDAERRSFMEKHLKLWLQDIQAFCYDVEDVLDEWRITTHRQHIQDSSKGEATEIRRKISSFLYHPIKRVVDFVQRPEVPEIINKIKELDSRLDQIMKDKDLYNLVPVTHTHISGEESKRVPTTSFVDASEIKGRDIDASDVIRVLVKDECGVRNGPLVISIVGAGGIGKTTLAQLVYGDERIKSHFDKRVWVCVSQPFDQIKIAKAIVESTTGSSPNLSELEVLLRKIQNTLSQKRFLLVLDDVWTEEDAKWAPFKNCLLMVGIPGSRILVTSRSERVAKMMGSVHLHRVKLISDSDAWLLLSRIAFSGRTEEAYEKLKEIGQKIAQKCKGLPLAVTVMGSLLRWKDTEEEWQHVFDSKIWEMEEVETDLFPHLYLSYDDLTPQMKRCFSYFAVFPKNYKIDVDDLIRIWMAQGYLTTKNGTSDQNQMELKGRDVFRNLAMRSFCQELMRVDLDINIILYCRMHDIVHDFAEFITKNECYSISQHEDEMQLENHRHLSWQKTGKPLDPASICDVIGNLHSFFAEHLSPEQLTPNMLNGLKSVRVLGLHGCKLQKLPNEIGNLIHLRLPEGIGNLHHLRKIYLTWSKVEELPDSICLLDNLQTLDLSRCGYLSRLPEGIGNLHHLGKIDLSWSKVEELPDSICSLDNLQTLYLRECHSLSRLPERIGNLHHLRKIYLTWSKVEELPDSICSLDNLEILDLYGLDDRDVEEAVRAMCVLFVKTRASDVCSIGNSCFA
nr:putative disease resistance protein RGA3 [Ipomoea batatas]